MKLSSINWGDDSAEKDPHLLHYFVQSAAFQRLRARQKNLVIGRKGAGKSAVRKKLEQTFNSESNTHVTNLSPKFNSIRNLLNDKDLSGGFGQEIFFQHTWIRQILLDCLCVVGHNAKGSYAKDSVEFARQISVQLNLTTKDLVENIADILSRLKAKAGNLGEFGLTLERELRTVAEVEALEHHFKAIVKGGARFVVLIDDLDLGWNNSEVANNLLLGLLSAVNYLSSLSQNIFPVVFLREDVYEILVTQTQHSDKYRNVERIRWDKSDLMSILNERIDFNRSLNGLAKLGNPIHTVFPHTIGINNTDNWLYDRTLGRPRELIQLARYYTESVDSDTPSADALKAAEQGYSEWKLADLCAEYSNQYPGLVSIFSYWKTKFFRSKYHLKRSELDERCSHSSPMHPSTTFGSMKSRIKPMSRNFCKSCTRSASSETSYKAGTAEARRYSRIKDIMSLDLRKFKSIPAFVEQSVRSKESVLPARRVGSNPPQTDPLRRAVICPAISI